MNTQSIAWDKKKERKVAGICLLLAGAWVAVMCLIHPLFPNSLSSPGRKAEAVFLSTPHVECAYPSRTGRMYMRDDSVVQVECYYTAPPKQAGGRK